jgi:hypothetical protein
MYEGKIDKGREERTILGRRIDRAKRPINENCVYTNPCKKRR